MRSEQPNEPADTRTQSPIRRPSAPPRSPVPGEAVPPAARRRLERPPSDRYAIREPETAPTGSFARAIVAAAVASLAGAGIVVILASPLALSEPLVLVALATGLAAGRAARWGGGGVVSGRVRRTIATSIVIAAIAAAQVVVWQLAIAEGGVLPLGDYLLAVFGPVAPLELVAAGLAAWASA
jgi:hypothetical protein